MRIFVAGTVNENINPKYLEGIKELGNYLIDNNHEIMCVGASTGSIGEMYTTFVERGGTVDIIVPVPYAHEATSMVANSKIVVDTLFQLQQIALRNSEATVVLPGGNGTLAELYMMTDNKKTKYDNDLILIFNINGFYDKIKEMNEFMLDNGCLTPTQANYFTFCNTPKEIIDHLTKWERQRKSLNKK